jgi:hypothetical protein
VALTAFGTVASSSVVPSGGCVHHGLGADVAAGARPVLDDEGLTQPFGQPLADQPRGDVDAAACGEAGNDAHRPRRIILRPGLSRQGGSGGDRGREFEEVSAI